MSMKSSLWTGILQIQKACTGLNTSLLQFQMYAKIRYLLWATITLITAIVWEYCSWNVGNESFSTRRSHFEVVFKIMIVTITIRHKAMIIERNVIGFRRNICYSQSHSNFHFREFKVFGYITKNTSKTFRKLKSIASFCMEKIFEVSSQKLREIKNNIEDFRALDWEFFTSKFGP